MNFLFDPTAFDNMKVVIEGALYDLDLAGEIVINDRNDFVNIAKMSRSFDISFELPETEKNSVIARIEIKSNLKNLAAELLSGDQSENQSGCFVKLEFFHDGVTKKRDLANIHQILLEIWGEKRIIRQTVMIHSTIPGNNNVITIDFDKVITEDHLEDLVEMVNHMITTMQRLQSYLCDLN